MVMQALNPRNARVLVVEDSREDQQIALRALKTYGIRYTQAVRTAEDALRDLEKHEYDVGLVDYALPGMNGLQLLEEMHRLNPRMRVIIVTGVRRENVAVEAMKLGAADYISKDDFLTAGIVNALQKALRNRKADAEGAQRTLAEGQTKGSELEGAAVEGAWLLQALDQRHGYTVDGRNAHDRLSEEWSELVRAFAQYIRAGCAYFPDIAMSEEEALLAMISERGLSPREIFRIYIAALRDIRLDTLVGADGTPVRPLLFAAHLFGAIVEELQTVISLQSLEDERRGSDAVA